MRSPETILSNLAIDVFRDLCGVGLDLVDVTLMHDLIADGGQHFLDMYWTTAEQADSSTGPEHSPDDGQRRRQS